MTNLAIDTVNTSRLKGTVAAKHGLTVAIGGLIKASKTRNERKVPLLGEVPVIGTVFRSTIESEEETELVLLITPYILNSPDASVMLQNSDNRFYQQYNRNFPDPAPAEPKFIKSESPSSKETPGRRHRKSIPGLEIYR